jgi:hypothetical protein
LEPRGEEKDEEIGFEEETEMEEIGEEEVEAIEAATTTWQRCGS